MGEIGIYGIRSILKPDRIYVGSAMSIQSRWRQHKSELKLKKHPNIKLQNHVNKYGLIDLEFYIIEQLSIASKEYILSKEQYYLDTLKPWFNILAKAGNCLGVKRSDESRAKQRHSLIGKRRGENNPMYGKTVLEIWIKKYGRKEALLRKLMQYQKIGAASKGRVNKNKGKSIPQERKDKISIGNKGKNTGIPPWNKGKKKFFNPITDKYEYR